MRNSTRERVRKAITELDYRPDLSARSLRGARAYALGLVYDNPNPYYIIGAQNGVLSVCREAGLGLQIHPCDSNCPTLNADLLSLVQRSRLAGLVLTPPMSERAALVRLLAEQQIRFVRIISAVADPGDGHPCVHVDDRGAAYEITKHIIQLGHERIGFLWGGAAHRSSAERFLGYQGALRDYGLPADRKLILPGDYAFDEGFRGARKLLALRSRPTAIFASNDEIAAGVLAAARSLGLDVPYDLSVAGFEDSPFSRQSWPALTTAKQDTAAIARHAAMMLVASLGADGLGAHGIRMPESRGFRPQLMIRGSTAPIGAAPPRAGRLAATRRV